MKKKRKITQPDDNKAGKICIGMILMMFVTVMSVQIYRVHQKDVEKIALEQELREQLQYEQDRKVELEEYQKYIQSKKYIEEQAQSRLSLLYDNQIIFRTGKN